MPGRARCQQVRRAEAALVGAVRRITGGCEPSEGGFEGDVAVDFERELFATRREREVRILRFDGQVAYSSSWVSARQQAVHAHGGIFFFVGDDEVTAREVGVEHAPWRCGARIVASAVGERGLVIADEHLRDRSCV